MTGVFAEILPLELLALGFGLSGEDLVFDSGMDGASVSLLTEYAFDLAPDCSNFGIVPIGGEVSGFALTLVVGSGDSSRLRILFVRRLDDFRVQYFQEFSSDIRLESGRVFEPSSLVPEISPIDDTWERVVIEDHQTTASEPKRFGRVRIYYGRP